MRLQSRIKQLEKHNTRAKFEQHCICFPADEPPSFSLAVELEAAVTVLCPLHGARFSRLAPSIFRVIRQPDHLNPERWAWHSEQYQKAMKASFPTDRWPAIAHYDPKGVIQWLLKDGTETHRIVLDQVYDYETNLPVFENGEPVFALSGPLALIVKEAKCTKSSDEPVQIMASPETTSVSPAPENRCSDDHDDIIVTIEE